MLVAYSEAMDKPLDLPRALRLIAGAVAGLVLVAGAYTLWIAAVATFPWWQMFLNAYWGGFLALAAFIAISFFGAYLMAGLIPSEALSGWGRLLAGSGISAALASALLALITPGWGPLVPFFVFGVALVVVVCAGIGEAALLRRPRWVTSAVISVGLVLALAGLVLVMT